MLAAAVAVAVDSAVVVVAVDSAVVVVAVAAVGVVELAVVEACETRVLVEHDEWETGNCVERRWGPVVEAV